MQRKESKNKGVDIGEDVERAWKVVRSGQISCLIVKVCRAAQNGDSQPERFQLSSIIAQRDG